MSGPKQVGKKVDRMCTKDWPDLGALHDLPAFPLDALPVVPRKLVAAIATSTQTPEDLAACAVLGVLSACLTGTSTVRVRDDWQEEINLFIICALESGDRKSSVLRAITAPLHAVQEERVEAARPIVAAARAKRTADEARQRKLTRDLGGEDDEGRAELVTELAAVELRLATTPAPTLPRMLADDATAEALARLLAAHTKIAIIEAESSFLDNIGGRYSDGQANLHLVCKSYSGETAHIDRAGSDPLTLQRPLLTLTLIIQPHVLDKLIHNRIAVEQGLVARCLLVRPKSRLGTRVMNPPPVPSRVSKAWDVLVHDLAAADVNKRDTSPTDSDLGPVQTGTEGTQDPTHGLLSLLSTPTGSGELHLAPEASALLDARATAQEELLTVKGRLRPVASWVNRDAGRIIRIAALLHYANHNTTSMIDAATIKNAIAIGDWALAHAEAILAMPPDRALDWLRDRPAPYRVSVREIHAGLFRKGQAARVEEAQALAAELVAYGALRGPIASPPTGGRPGSPVYEIHPDLPGATT